MVEVKVLSDKIIFDVEGWDKLWTLKSHLEIPIANIKGAKADPAPAMGWFQGFKRAGTDIPNIFRAGTFYQDGNLVFWDVHNPQNTIVIDLIHEHYTQLIIEVSNPSKTVALINKSIIKEPS